MFKKTLVCLSILTCSILSAQDDQTSKEDFTASNDLKIGLKGGLSLPSLSDNSDNIYTEHFKSFASFEGGLFANYGINNNMSVQLELNYARKGGERDGFQPIPPSAIESNLPLEIAEQIPPGTVFYADFKNRNELEYLEIPILFKYTYGTDWRFFANAGPYLGFLLKATQVTSGNSEIYFDENQEIVLFPESSFDAETDVKDNLNKVNFGGVFGLGVTRNITPKSELLFEVRGSYGFIPLQKDETFGKSRVGSVLFSVGYVYSL